MITILYCLFIMTYASCLTIETANTFVEATKYLASYEVFVIILLLEIVNSMRKRGFIEAPIIVVFACGAIMTAQSIATPYKIDNSPEITFDSGVGLKPIFVKSHVDETSKQKFKDFSGESK